MEATLILARIVRRWQVELVAGQRLELKPSVTLRQKGPRLRVGLAERAAKRVEVESVNGAGAHARA